MKNEKVVIRQEEDDDGETTAAGLPQLVPGILKIVGSALAGNITSVIDSSVALFPAEANIGGKISEVITTLVDSVRNATGVGVVSNKAPTSSNKVSSASTVKNVVTTTTVRTTSSDEEESEEILRTNTSARPLSNTVASESTSRNKATTLLPTTQAPTSTAPPSPTTDTIDNKANWISLLFNASESIQSLNIVAEDSQEITAAAPSTILPASDKPVRGNDKGPTDDSSFNSTTAKPNGSLGSKLSLSLSANRPDLSNFTDILTKFDHLAYLTGINRITDAEVTTTAIPVTVTATAATLGANGSSVTNNAQVGPITIFSEFDRTTEPTTLTTEEDEDEDEDEDENRAIS